MDLYKSLQVMQEEFSSLKEKLTIWWGMIFRGLVIACVGTGGYLIFSPGPIGDTPLSSLTLSQIGGALISVLVPFGCINWFFRFPQREFDSKESPYLAWATAGVWSFWIAIGLWLFFSRS